MPRLARTALAVVLAAAAGIGIAAPPASAAGIGAPVTLPLAPGMTWGVPTAISGSGAVAGSEGNADGCATRAVRWSGGNASVLPVPDGLWSRGYGLDSTGTVVGYVSYRLPTEAHCTTPVTQAVSWAPDGTLTYLAPDYRGTTVATGIDDAGDVVGLAVPEGAGADRARGVRFAGGHVLPVSPEVFDDRPGWDPASNYRQGPALTNLPQGNLAVGVSFDQLTTRAYATALGPGSFIPEGTAHWLGDNPGHYHPLCVSADGSVIAGDGFTQGTMWRKIFRSGHPSYKAYQLADLPNNRGHFNPTAASPDGSLLVGQGDFYPEGYLYQVTSGTYLVAPDANFTGIGPGGRIIGTDHTGHPMTWQYTG